MAVSQERITVYNLADLKNTSDDAIPNYLNSLKFTQSHRLTDVRLSLGFSAFTLAAACFLWDYKFGFESTKLYTGVAVTIYTLLNGLLTYWIFYVEKGTIYEGTAPSGEKIKISTSTPKKTVPEYHLNIEIEPSKKAKGGKKESFVIIRPFTEWFNAAGHFVVAPFQGMLAQSISVVGKADPKRAAPPAGVVDQPPVYSPEMLAALADAQVSVVGSAAETAATGSDAAKKAAAKRRKA
ncbi:signal peptidase complex subunit SPC2 [Rhypophila sp. PSN 637]